MFSKGGLASSQYVGGGVREGDDGGGGRLGDVGVMDSWRTRPGS